MKGLQKKLNKKAYTLFNNLNKYIKFNSFINKDCFNKELDNLKKSFEEESKDFKLTQKNINLIYENLLIENFQNQIKIYNNHIYIMKNVWTDLGRLNLNDFSLVLEYFSGFTLSLKNAKSILKNVIDIMTIYELDDSVMQLNNCYIEDGNLKYGKYLDGIPKFNIDKIFLNKNIKEKDFPNISNELNLLCNNDLDMKEFLLENLATIFITNFEIKNSFNSFIKINNNKTFLKILANTFGDENLINLKDLKVKDKNEIDNTYLSALYSSVIVSSNKKTNKQVININKSYHSDLNDISDNEYFLFFNFLLNKSLQILQRNPISLINKSNAKNDTFDSLKNYLFENKDNILYFSVKKVREDYEIYCKVNKIKSFNKSEFNLAISNVLNLKQATTWSNLLKDKGLKTKRTYAWLPNR